MGSSPQNICTLFSIASGPVQRERPAFLWLQPEKFRAEKDAHFIESLCERIYHLPRVYAATQSVPELGHIPIKATSNSADVIGLYRLGDGIEISVKKHQG